MRRIVFSIILTVLALGISLYVYRKASCPDMIVMAEFLPDSNRIDELRLHLDTALLSPGQLGGEVSGKKVILVGEVHFQQQVMNYFVEFLQDLEVDHFVLALELPASVQPHIDAFMDTGDEQHLSSIIQCEACLPYAGIIRWCAGNKQKVVRVEAIDENRRQIVINRALCTDTRNDTMTDRILALANTHPEAPLVFYGGQLHCLKSGRYLFDVDSRTPIGSRLMKTYSMNEVCTIILNGNGNFPASPAWTGRTGGIVVPNNFQRRYFVNEPVVGGELAVHFIDYIVNVGDLKGL